ncbi:MAG: hypothetical protein EOP13_25150 [Pseudomonas sp.]|uniref:hypothetical protein n=1 Tax=Pseudomonas sp. TaxID=306 RepID=UPI0011FAB037|nr:hypothetical protein [Pseudomonas sp.]RZI68405.1 MAG: hypothetical protein EOP13_25150 [Pseudomonas sp.]
MSTRAEKAAATMAHARELEPVIQKLVAAGITGLSGIARALNDGGYPAIQGGLWVPAQVDILLQRLDLR